MRRLLLLAALAAGCHKAATADVPPAPIPPPPPVAEPPAKPRNLTVAAVFRECERVGRNQAAAEEPFGGKPVKVTAALDDVRFADNLGRWTVYLVDRPGSPYLRCLFTDKDRGRLAALRPGSAITVEGVAWELMPGTGAWVLERCRLSN